MLSLKFVTLLCALVAVHCEDYEKDEHVLVLKQTNFDKAVTEHKHVLVKFCECLLSSSRRFFPAREVKYVVA